MRIKTHLALAVLAALVTVLSVSTASADSFVGSIFLVDPTNPLATPTLYPGPYGTVTIDLTSSTTANITFEALTNGNYQYLFMDGSSVGLVLSSTDVSVSGLTGTTLNANFSGPDLSYELATGNPTVDGVGDYNLRITEFDGYDWALETISFTLTLNSGTWATAKSVIDNTQNIDQYIDSTNGQLVTSASWVEAHIAVCDTSLGACSPSIAALQTGFAGGAAASVSESGTMMLLGAGLLVGGVLTRRIGIRS
jgi:hypothetical protein